MTELNMQTVRDTVIDYVSNGNTVPDNMSAEEYADAMWDMDSLCNEMYDVCEAAGVGPDGLDEDEFIDLLEKHDTGEIVEVEIMRTQMQKTFDLGVSARKTDTISTPRYYKDTDEYVRMNLYINAAIYGKPGVMLDFRLSNLVDVYTDDSELNEAFKEEEEKGDKELEHSVLCVGDDFIDLTAGLVDFEDIAEPEMDVMWYHNGKCEVVTLPIEIIKDTRI